MGEQKDDNISEMMDKNKKEKNVKIKRVVS